MLKKLLIIGVYLTTPFTFLYAQNASITGTVTDAQTEEVIPGANIFIQSIQRGTTTDADGEYTISNLNPGTYILRVSFIGYKTVTQEVEVGTGQVTQNFQLSPDLVGLEDIVVTAQQIEREERELGYTVNSIKGEEINKVKDTNLLNNLAGKVPGVQIQQQSGTVGGSTRILIRGNATLSGNNQPLFVVDGIPVFNSNIVDQTSSATRLSGGAVDVGNRGGDMSPEDIADVSVLKGAAAAALYGQRAQNGVILITTKRGKEGSGTNVTVNSSVRTSSPLRLPDYQNEYAQGDQGNFDVDDLSSWGPKIEGQTVTDWKGDEVQLRAFEDNISNFFQNGLELSNSISVSGADEQSDFRLSVTNLDQEGIVPSSILSRTNIAINSGKDITEKLTARISANYSFTETNGRPIQGGNSPNALMETVLSLPANISTEDLKNNTIDPNTGEQIGLTGNVNNPYFITDNNGFDNDVERLFGNGTITYTPIDWVSITARVGTDFYTENRLNNSSVGTLGALNGEFAADRIQQRQINSDLLVTFDRQLTEDFSLKGTLGHNINIRKLQLFSNTSRQLAVKDLINFSNAESNSPTNLLEEQRLVGVYGETTLGYQDYLFLTLTGRNDWSSTLPKDNNSFFYPSANVSFIFTEGLNIDSNILSYGKIRANIAEVGSDEDPYQLDFRFFPISERFGQFGTDLLFPFGGQLAFSATNTVPPSDLKPQQQVSIEVGTELQFLGGRVGVDFTWYNTTTRDQIITIPTPQSTGFSGLRTNVGEIKNEGIEALLSLTPVRNRFLQWTSTLNFTRNVNEVVTLAPGVSELQVNSAFNGLTVKAKPGKPLSLFGTGWLRNDAGQIIINKSNGLRVQGSEVNLGKMDPDWQLGINNNFSIKAFDISFLFDIRKGGTVVSGTVQDIRFNGAAAETAELRGTEFIDKGGVIGDDTNGDGVPDANFRENDVPVENIQAFYENQYDGSLWEESAFDASYVKLRELRVGYNFPRKWLQSTPITNASISFEARNFWLIWSAAPDIDPETNVFGSGVIGQGIEFNNIPSVKSYGVNVRFTL